MQPSNNIECKHKFVPHFHQLVDKTDTTMRVGVCIVCTECGMFRTKILEFRFQKEIKGI